MIITIIIRIIIPGIILTRIIIIITVHNTWLRLAILKAQGRYYIH